MWLREATPRVHVLDGSMNPLRSDVGWLISGDSGSELGLREINLNLLAYALEP